jgi:repressor LexA
MEKISNKQQELYDFIKKYIANNGYAPTIRELAYIFQRSTGSIHPMLKRLKQKGLIDYEEKMSRTIKILN